MFVNVRWYSDDTQLSVPTNAQTCSYDGDLYLPTPPTKKGYTFEGWKVTVPTGYTELEYIQATGTQYIDTGVPGDNNNYNIIADFMVTEYNCLKSGCGISIVQNNPSGSSGFNVWRILVYDRNRKLLLYTNTHTTYPRLSWSFAPTIQLNQRYLVNFDYNRAIVNGTQHNYDNLNLGTTNNNTIKIFNVFASSVTGKANIYSFVLYESGQLVRNMIPARRNSDNVVGMYDTVTGTFFTNAGSGTFTAGPVVQ